MSPRSIIRSHSASLDASSVVCAPLRLRGGLCVDLSPRIDIRSSLFPARSFMCEYNSSVPRTMYAFTASGLIRMTWRNVSHASSRRCAADGPYEYLSLLLSRTRASSSNFSGEARRANNARWTRRNTVAATTALITTATIGKRKKRKKCLMNSTVWTTRGGSS